VLNKRLDVLLLYYGLVQLPFHHFVMNTKEVIVSISLFDLVFQAFLHILKLLAKVIMLLPNPL
jgi:hypothetical protein